jgi:hypothetical protein
MHAQAQAQAQTDRHTKTHNTSVSEHSTPLARATPALSHTLAITIHAHGAHPVAYCVVHERIIVSKES